MIFEIKSKRDTSRLFVIQQPLNDSKVHVDFMIGTEDLDIVAETEQGKIKIMEVGKWIHKKREFPML